MMSCAMWRWPKRRSGPDDEGLKLLAVTRVLARIPAHESLSIFEVSASAGIAFTLTIRDPKRSGWPAKEILRDASWANSA